MKRRGMHLIKSLLLTTLLSINIACQTFSRSTSSNSGLSLPYLKNSATECYYLDEFMPVPNALITGKTGALKLRYYTYNTAHYKDWPESHVILSFYSSDEQCWSLFEEYTIAN